MESIILGHEEFSHIVSLLGAMLEQKDLALSLPHNPSAETRIKNYIAQYRPVHGKLIHLLEHGTSDSAFAIHVRH